MLDAFDVMLYALLLTSIIADLGMTTRTGGAIGSVTLLAAAGGGRCSASSPIATAGRAP